MNTIWIVYRSNSIFKQLIYFVNLKRSIEKGEEGRKYCLLMFQGMNGRRTKFVTDI